MVRTIVGAVAALAAALAGGGAALAASTGPAHRPATSTYGSATPQGSLTLTYMAQAGYAAAVTLTCGPAGGGHPEAKQACATLRVTGADPDRIKPAPVMCMMLYAPVTAQISGSWRGTPVTWTHLYGNSCEMTRATGVLFKF